MYFFGRGYYAHTGAFVFPVHPHPTQNKQARKTNTQARPKTQSKNKGKEIKANKKGGMPSKWGSNGVPTGQSGPHDKQKSHINQCLLAIVSQNNCYPTSFYDIKTNRQNKKKDLSSRK